MCQLVRLVTCQEPVKQCQESFWSPQGRTKCPLIAKEMIGPRVLSFSTECPEKVNCQLHESGHRIFLTHCGAPRPSTCLLAITIDERVNE